MTAAFGKYVLLRKLATGGMGEVFLAKQVGPSGFEKLLVIKRILAHHHDKHEYLDMFLSEAKLVARLTHGNIIQIHEMGQIDGDYFIAMEYLRGKSLRDIIDALRSAGQKLPLAYVVDLAIKLCDGLGYAHGAKDIRGRAMNIIHRDVNPHNVLISYNGDLKLIDFGIAKSEMASVHTATGTIKGKFVYMSPEQSAADPIDRRSDIFSLGIVLYEMTTNENPFVRQNVVLSLEAIQRHPVPSPETKRIDAGPLSEILEKALQKRPEDRYQTCEEMRDDLRDLFRSGRLKPEEQDLSVFLGDLFVDDIEEEDRLLAEADQATAQDTAGATLSVAPDLGHDYYDDEDADITRRGRPPAPTPEPRAPIPIDSEPFSDEEPTIAGDLDSIAYRSRMSAADGLPQPEPTGQVLTLIPPEDVVGGSSADFGAMEIDPRDAVPGLIDDPSTPLERVPEDAPGSVNALVPIRQDADPNGDGSDVSLVPAPQHAIGMFQEPLSPSDGTDPRNAETKEIRRNGSAVHPSDTPVAASQVNFRSDPPPRDPSVSLPAYAGAFRRRSMVVAAALVFVLTAVAGYWLMRAFTHSGTIREGVATPVAPEPTAAATVDVVPAPDPQPPAAAKAAVVPPKPEVETKPAPKVAKKKRSKRRRRKRRRRAPVAVTAPKKTEPESIEDPEDAPTAKAPVVVAQPKKVAPKPATKREAPKPAASPLATTQPKVAQPAETPPIPRTPAAKPARSVKAKSDGTVARKGILTIRGSANVSISHGSRSAGSAPSSLIVRRNSGTVSIGGEELQLLVKLRYTVTSEGLSVGVESKPWAIVKHNGISLGKTPQGPVAAGKRHRFSLLRPGQRTPLVISLVWNPTAP